MKKETAERVAQLWAEIQKFEKEREQVIKSSNIAIYALIPIASNDCYDHKVNLSDTERLKIRQDVIKIFDERIKNVEKELEIL